MSQPRQAEIGHFRVHLLVEEDVAGLDVAVVNRRDGGEVEVSQSLRRVVSDSETVFPREMPRLCGGDQASEMLEKRPVFDELIDHYRLLELDAAAEEAD